MPPARDQAPGVGRLPNGAAFYLWRLKLQTTTDLTPEQVHQLSLQQVAEIECEVSETITNLLKSHVGICGMDAAQSVAFNYNKLNTCKQFHHVYCVASMQLS